MDYGHAVANAIRINTPHRSYRCCRSEFGMRYEQPVTSGDLCSGSSVRPADDGYDVVEAGGAAWILHGGMVAFRPAPIYGKLTRVGVEEPYRWEFDPDNLLDQTDDVCRRYGVRLVAGRAYSDGTGWRAYFVDTDLPGRRVHGRELFGRFMGATLEEVLWSAVRDVRAFDPQRPAATQQTH